MCGIFGASDRERFDTLYKLNKDRGSFAYGGLYISDNEGITVQKREGNCIQVDSTQRRYYMGHTQGPTSSQREFNSDTGHPFQFEHWHVAHNGVLSNSKELAEEYEVNNPVDSAIIPKLIAIKELASKDEVDAICEACSELRGTFSCWIYNDMSEEAYLVRCGSTLFANNEGEFSSTEEGMMRPLEEGVIYCVDYIHSFIYPLSKFLYRSPFFIL